MMKRALAALAVLLALGVTAQAQNPSQGRVVTSCGTPGITYTAGAFGPTTVDENGNLCINPGGGGSGTTSLVPTTSGGALVSSTILPNNTTAIVPKASPGQVYGIECYNNSATIAYIKMYDATSATAGSGTPAVRYMCPSSTSGAGFVISYPNGRQFLTGIAYVVTTGIADNDTTAPAANTYIVNVHYK